MPVPSTWPPLPSPLSRSRLPRRLASTALCAGLALASACVGGTAAGPEGALGSDGGGLGGGNVVPGDPNGGPPGDPNGTGFLDPPGQGNLPADPNPASSPNDGNAPGQKPNSAPMGPAQVSSDGDGNFTVGPSFQQDANVMGLVANAPAGKWTTFYVPGSNSAYYTGKAAGLKQTVDINRQVQVFVPAQYKSGELAPLLVLMDGGDFQYTLKTTVPNLIAQGALPPLVAITVSAGSNAGTYNERSYEYDVVSTRWSDYIENEILPLVEQNAGVKITKNPALRGTMGGSSGGSAAVTMAWLHPDRYTRVFSFSGSMVKLWPTDDYPDGGWFYPAGGIAAAAKKNLRISLMVGANDLNAGSGSMTDWLLANRKVATQLIAKGYPYRFTVVAGGGHESADALKQCTATELAWAWRGWQQSTP